MADDQLAAKLAHALAARGGTAIFGLPGGGPNLDVVAAAQAEGLRFHLAHAETEAAIMASTYGLLTGVPAAVVATRGPGAASLANGAAQATLDRYPLVVVTDTVRNDQADRVAHQRLDQRAMFAPLTKHSVTLGATTDEAAIRELVDSAGRWPFGAVHFDYDPSASPDQTAQTGGPGTPERAPAEATLAAIGDARAVLSAATRPLIIVGAEAAALGAPLRAILERAGCPVLTTYQAVGTVPTEGGLHAGLFTNGALERPVIDAADVIVTIGLDLVEPIPAEWTAAPPVIRISAVAQDDDYMPSSVDLVGDVLTIATEILADVETRWPGDAGREFNADSRSWLRGCESPTVAAGRIGPVALVEAAAAHVPPSATVTVDAGAHFLAIMPLWPVARPYGLLISNGLATMGFALPAAIGAALARPGEPVLALTGDGGMGMVLAELETVARLELPITIVVFNDAALSLIDIKQRTGATADAVRYRPVDFAAIARASGIGGHVVKSVAEFEEVLAEAWDSPRLIDVALDPSSYRSLMTATRG